MKSGDVAGQAVVRLAQSGDLMAVVDAVPAALSRVRAQVRAWLAGLGWPVEDGEDVELAVNEAVANVIDHAYLPDVAGSASVHGWVSHHLRTRQRRVIVAVTDRGRWAAFHPSSPSPAARGHGLGMMRGCMAEVHIQPGAAGTSVIMISNVVAVIGATTERVDERMTAESTSVPGPSVTVEVEHVVDGERKTIEPPYADRESAEAAASAHDQAGDRWTGAAEQVSPQDRPENRAENHNG